MLVVCVCVYVQKTFVCMCLHVVMVTTVYVFISTSVYLCVLTNAIYTYIFLCFHTTPTSRTNIADSAHAPFHPTPTHHNRPQGPRGTPRDPKEPQGTPRDPRSIHHRLCNETLRARKLQELYANFSWRFKETEHRKLKADIVYLVGRLHLPRCVRAASGNLTADDEAK